MNCLPRYSRCISSLPLAESGIRRVSLPALLLHCTRCTSFHLSLRVALLTPHSALFALTSLPLRCGLTRLRWGRALVSVGRFRFYSLRCHYVRSRCTRIRLHFATASFPAHVLPFPHRSAPFFTWGYRPKPRRCSQLRYSLDLNVFKLGLSVKGYSDMFFKRKFVKSKIKR